MANDFSVLSEDGAWCWFADPRAIYYEGEKNQSYFSWVSSQGDIVVASYNHDTFEYNEKIIHPKLEIDDHDVPALFIRDDGHIVVFYSKHQAAGPMQRVISTKPEDISSFSEAYTWGSNVSYPNPFKMGGDIALIYRGLNWHPTIAVSKDDGVSFTDIKQLVLNGGDRPYARYCQSGDGAIHVAVTTGHPRNEAKNQIFYFKLKDNKFYRADGSLIKEFNTGIDLGGKGNNTGVGSEAEIVYDGVSNGRAWVWDMTLDPETQNPVIVYASMPTESDHRYNYAYWDNGDWINKEITKAGKWFPQTPPGTTEREPHYSGGISMDYSNPWLVYLSKEVNAVFEIFKYETKDKGDTWEITAITENTPADIVNVRPIVPRNHNEGDFDVLWMRGKYRYYYQDFNTAVVFQMKNRTDKVTNIELDATEIKLNIGGVHKLKAKLYPLISNTQLRWTSSDNTVATVENGLVTSHGIGEAEISATTVNGLTATCTVNVTEIEYFTAAFFDFGLENSPVASAAIQVTENTLIQGSSFGWLSPVMARNRSSGNAERRDFNMNSTPAVFKVYVENGLYNVSVLQGDADYMHDKMRIKVNNEIKVSEVTAAKGQFITSNFEVNVDNNEMNFEFSRHGTDPNWVVNSIRFEKNSTSVQDIDELIFLPGTLVKIFDSQGKFIVEKEWDNSNFKYSIESLHLPKGIYFLQAQLINDKFVKKIIL